MSSKSTANLIEVTAYSGYKANERPLYFTKEQTRIQVKTILDRWYGPEYDYFKVLGEDGLEYLLGWRRYSDSWFLFKALEAENRSAE